MGRHDRVDVLLVAGGRWHDVDYARARLLGLLVEHDVTRTSVVSDYADLAVLERPGSVLVTWTCDVRPSAEQSQALADFVARGGRWLALHGSNSAIDVVEDEGRRRYATPRALGAAAEVLGSQFLAHPPIAPVHRAGARARSPTGRRASRTSPPPTSSTSASFTVPSRCCSARRSPATAPASARART